MRSKTPASPSSRRSLLMWTAVAGILIGAFILFDGVFQIWYYQQAIARVNRHAISRDTWNAAVQQQCGPTILDQLVNQQLVEEAINKAHITVSEEEVTQQVNKELTAYGKTPDEFWRDLKTRGIDEATYRYRTELTLSIQKLLKPGLPQPSEAEIATYIEQHADDPEFKEIGLSQEQIHERAKGKLLEIALAGAQSSYPDQLREQSSVDEYYLSKPKYQFLRSLSLLLGL